MNSELTISDLVETPGEPEAFPWHAPAIEQVVRAMHADGDRLDLHSMAEIAHLSPFHFSRVFRSVTGAPPGVFLSALRLERAKSLLLSTDLSVTDVCFEVGYSSLGTFTTRFTQLVGIPPSVLRGLPHAFQSVLEHVDFRAEAEHHEDGGLRGTVTAPELGDALIFLGLFPSAVPQRRPVAGAVLTSPGPFRIPRVPAGTHHLLAAALPAGSITPTLVGRSDELVSSGVAPGSVHVALRPPRLTDPPVLVALPPLLLGCERVRQGLEARKGHGRMPELLAPGA